MIDKKKMGGRRDGKTKTEIYETERSENTERREDGEKERVRRDKCRRHG